MSGPHAQPREAGVQASARALSPHDRAPRLRRQLLREGRDGHRTRAARAPQPRGRPAPPAPPARPQGCQAWRPHAGLPGHADDVGNPSPRQLVAGGNPSRWRAVIGSKAISHFVWNATASGTPAARRRRRSCALRADRAPSGTHAGALDDPGGRGRGSDARGTLETGGQGRRRCGPYRHGPTPPPALSRFYDTVVLGRKRTNGCAMSMTNVITRDDLLELRRGLPRAASSVSTWPEANAAPIPGDDGTQRRPASAAAYVSRRQATGTSGRFWRAGPTGGCHGRTGSATLALFFCAEPEWFWWRSLHLPLASRFVWMDAPYLRPLVALLDHAPPVGVVTVAQGMVRVLTWKQGILQEGDSPRIQTKRRGLAALRWARSRASSHEPADVDVCREIRGSRGRARAPLSRGCRGQGRLWWGNVARPMP